MSEQSTNSRLARLVADGHGTLTGTVEAQVLRSAIIALALKHEGRPEGLTLDNVRVAGRLCLNDMHIPFPLKLTGQCVLDKGLTLERACVHHLSIGPHCRLTAPNAKTPALAAGRLTTDHGLEIAATVTGEVRLLGANISGQLSLKGATLTNDNGDAFNADGVTVTGNVFMHEGFTATGKVRLPYDLRDTDMDEARKLHTEMADLAHTHPTEPTLREAWEVGNQLFIASDRVGGRYIPVDPSTGLQSWLLWTPFASINRHLRPQQTPLLPLQKHLRFLTGRQRVGSRSPTESTGLIDPIHDDLFGGCPLTNLSRGPVSTSETLDRGVPALPRFSYLFAPG